MSNKLLGDADTLGPGSTKGCIMENKLFRSKDWFFQRTQIGQQLQPWVKAGWAGSGREPSAERSEMFVLKG